MRVLREIVVAVFEEIRESFPELAMRDSESEGAAPQLEILAQKRPSGSGWQSISRNYQGFSFPWRTEQRVLQRVAG